MIFRTAGSSMAAERGGPENFNFDAECFVIDLLYRRDCGGNPGIAYDVIGARYERRADLLSKEASFRESQEANEEMLKEMKEAEARANPRFAGMLTILVFMESYCAMIPYAVSRDERRSAVMSPAESIWLASFRLMARQGHIIRQPSGERFQLGRVKRRGKKWQWVQYTPDDYKKMNIPPFLASCILQIS